MSAAKYSFGIATIVTLAVAAPSWANENLYRKVVQATAYISKSDGPQANSTGTGTGFLIDEKERLLITARHVVETKAGVAEVVAVVFSQTVDGEVMTDSEYYRKNWATLAVRGKVVYESVRRDMAVIQVEKLPPGLKPLELAPNKAKPGQTIHVIGNSSVVLGGMFNYCQGHVRNTFRYVGTGANVIATQAPTNRGDSGGPVVNDLGEVVGFCSLSTGGQRNKTDPLDGDQLVDLSICVSEIRIGLSEMKGHVASTPDADPKKTRTFKGQAQSSVHLANMEKDVTYRILVKAENFTPELRVEEPEKKGAINNPFTNSVRSVTNEIQMLFTTKETAEYRIVVAYASGTDMKKGPFRYSITIDQADFETESVVKEPELKINERVTKFEAGKVYDIIVKGKGFEPDLRVMDGSKTVATQFNNGVKSVPGKGGFLEKIGLAQEEYATTLRFVASKTADFRILIAVSPFSPAGVAKRPYTMTIAERTPDLSVVAQLTAKDPLYPRGGPFKAYAVKLTAGKTYQADLLTTAFDSKLLLEDASGTFLMQGFDADGFNARLIFSPVKTGTYRFLASAHMIDSNGAFTLVVAESPNMSPVTAPPPDKKIPPKGEPEP